MEQGKGSTAQRLQAMPYDKRVCRIEHYPRCLAPDRILGPVDESVPCPSMEEEVEAIHAAGTEVWAISGFRTRGIPLYPSKILTPPDDLDLEAIPRFLDMAHEKGMIVLTYYPFIFNYQLADLRPEWMIQMLDDGGEEVWNEGWFCWNSPFRDWLPEYLSEILDHLDFDGIYFDDMNWGSHSDHNQRRTGGCHCSYCRDLYRKETGRELQVKVDMDSADFRRFVNWRYEKFVEAMEHFTRKLHQRHPDAIVDFNYYSRPYGSPDIGWMTGHPLNPMDMGTRLFVEAGLDNMGPGVPTKICQATGVPFGIWLWATQSLVDCVSHSAPYPEPYSAMIYGLTAVAHGGASVTTCLDAGEHTLYGDTLKSVFSELLRLRDHVGDETVKYLALHVSQQTRDFAPAYRNEPDRYWQLLRGGHEILSRSQFLMEYVFDRQLEGDALEGYEVLFLSNSACLSSAEGDAVRRFVERGGRVIATHQTSLYDELGQARDNFLLADVFGVDHVAEGAEGEEIDAKTRQVQEMRYGRIAKADESNIYVPQTGELRDLCGLAVCFGAPQSSVSVPPGSAAQVLCTKSSLRWTSDAPLKNFYAGMDYDSGEPAVTSNSFGRGTAVYICGDVGAGYERHPLPQLRRFLSYLVRQAREPIEVQAHKAIEVTATRLGPGTINIHLLNNPLAFLPWSQPVAQHRTHFYLDEIPPVHDVIVRLPAFEVRSASLPMRDRELEVGADGSIVVPKVEVHEVVSVNLK